LLCGLQVQPAPVAQNDKLIDGRKLVPCPNVASVIRISGISTAESLGKAPAETAFCSVYRSIG
jgi:hypothetical protein